MQNAIPIVVGIIFGPSKSISFFETISTHFSKVDSNKNEIYMLNDFIINLYLNNSCIFFQKNNLLQSKVILNANKKYYELS